MKQIFFILCFLPLLCNSPVFAQIDFSRYVDENALPLLELDDPLKVNFKWTMGGKIQADLNEGMNNLDEHNLKLAVSNFNHVIDLDSTLWMTYYYRGAAFKELRQFKSAESDFLKALKLNPSQAEIYLELGELYHANRSFEKAFGQYEKAVEVNPGLVQAYYNLGSLSLMKGDLKKGLRYFEKCNEINPKFPEAYMMEGILKFKARKKDQESVTYFNKALQADSTYSQTYYWRGLAYLSMGQTEKCLTDWNMVIRFNPENSFYLLMRGFLQIELNHFDEAFTDMRKALRGREVNEDKFHGQQSLLDKQIDLQYGARYIIQNGYGLTEASFGYLKKGFCLLLADRKQDALANLDESEKLEPSATVYFIKAILYEHNREHVKAFTFYNKALSLDNEIFDAHKKRSIYRFEVKDWKGAYADLNEMFRLQPESPAAYRLRGLIKSNETDYRGAIDDLTRFIQSDSTDEEAFRTRGVCRQLTSDFKGANQDYLRVLQIKDVYSLYEYIGDNYLALQDTSSAFEFYQRFGKKVQDIHPHIVLAGIYVNFKKLDAATEEIRTVNRLMGPRSAYFPDYVSQILFLEGKIEFQHKDYEKSIEKFSKALRKDKNNKEVLYFRAKAYQLSGLRKEALADYGKLKESNYLNSDSLYQALLNQ